MTSHYITIFLDYLSNIDPSPFFVLSLFPYLLFLNYASKSKSIPEISLWGFKLTLGFVLITILLAIVALKIYGGELTDVDYLHGTAESFLTISDGLVVLGFLGLGKKKVIKNS